MRDPNSQKPSGLSLVTAKGEEILVTGSHFIIGRAPDCHFRPEAISISRRHTLIVREADGYFVEDMGSALGTRLNQESVDGRRRLSDGDELMLADVKLRVRFR